MILMNGNLLTLPAAIGSWAGWPETGAINTVQECQAIDISNLKSVAPHTTTQMRFTGNLNSNIAINYSIDDTVTPPVNKALEANGHQ